MKMRNIRKLLALTLAAALILPLLRASCRAADSYIITVAEDTVLENTEDAGMALFIDGIIYVPYTTLQELDRTWVAYNESKSLVTVYRVGYMMYFELDTGLTYNNESRYVQVSAKVRSGVPYLPVQVICSWMGLYFSYTSASAAGLSYPIMRLARQTPTTDDETLFRQQAETLKSVSRSRDIRSGILAPEADPVPAPEPEARDISLLFSGVPEEGLSFLLDTLEGADTPAAFFLPYTQLNEQAEQLRELYARGFSFGFSLSGEMDPVQEAQNASDLCARLLHIRVRLVLCAQTMTEEEQLSLKEAGFVPVTAEQDYSFSELNAKKLLSALKKLLRNGSGDEALLLRPDDIVQEILPVVCSYLTAQNYTALPVKEW